MPISDSKKVAAIVADAGGRVVGRTRLQKIAYLLSVTGLEDGFSFAYKHYGPFSDDFASAVRNGHLLGDLVETEQTTGWGGSYSVFTVPAGTVRDERRRKFAKAAAEADALELELAATAVFLAREGDPDPWAETARRKPEKIVGGRLVRARQLLTALSQIPTPVRLPPID